MPGASDPIQAVMEALSANEKVYRLLFETMNEGFILLEAILDDQGEVADWLYVDLNPACARIMGRDREILVGRTARELLPGLEDYWYEAARKVAFGVEPIRMEGYACPLGCTLAVSLYSPVRGQVACILTDISDRARAATAERTVEELFSKAFTFVPMAMAITDLATGQFLAANGAFLAQFGYTMGELRGRTTLELGLWANPETRAKVLEGLLERGEAVAYDTPLRRKDGEIRWVALSCKALDLDGRTCVVACMPDITEHRQAKADLREREHLLDVFIDHMPAAIAMLDKDMRYIFTSRSWCRDFGAGIETFTGRSHYELYPELPERCRTILRRALGGATERGEREPFPRQDGSLDWVTWEVRPWREADGTLGGLIIEAELLARLPALPPGLS